MKLPNTIIAGTNKAGTTSLFRYLADHPHVCGSRVKETCFFMGAEPRDLTAYSGLFSHCGQEARVRIEATPGYLVGGRVTAKAIHDAIPDVKLIFLLREPVARLMSLFRRNQSRASEELDGLNVDEFVTMGLESSTKPLESLDAQAREVWLHLRAGCYADLLKEYLELFPPEQILLVFYDDLAEDPGIVLKSVCKFLDLDYGHYDGFAYSVENKTRSYRSRSLHRMVFHLNRWVEPVFNRYPSLRRSVRALYNWLNEQPDEGVQTHEAAERRLTAFYASHNAALKNLIADQLPVSSLPRWVSAV